MHDLKVQGAQKPCKISNINVENQQESPLKFLISPVTPKYTEKSVYLQVPNRIDTFDFFFNPSA